MLFTDLPLDNRLLKSLNTMQLDEMTDVQAKSIPHALLGKDIVASSRTGSGKTLAYRVPLVQRLLNQKALSRRDPRAVILAPTRELAKQVFIETKKLLQSQSLSVTLIVGGENFNDQVNSLKRRPQIIVGTAGRVADHVVDKSVFLQGTEILVLDEADRMFDLGFSEQLNTITAQANHRKRQTMLFSATLDTPDVQSTIAEYMQAPEVISIDDIALPHSDIQQSFYFADNVSHKDSLLQALLRLSGRQQGMIFTATRDDSQRIASQLDAQGIDAVCLHGELLQAQRSSVINAFSRGQHSVLVTTDLGARGLDLSNVALVINYDLPKHADEYIHRIGRTGRAGSQGIAISLIGKRDWLSFCAIKMKLQQAYEFSTVEGLEAKFSGIVPRRVKSQPSNKAENAKEVKSNERHPVKRTRSKQDLSQLPDAGAVPIMRKKPAVDEDNTED